VTSVTSVSRLFFFVTFAFLCALRGL
jgi:hypothetical protein